MMASSRVTRRSFALPISQVRSTKLSPCTVADVQHINLPPPAIDPVNDAIEMWPLAIEEVPEPLIFRRDGTAI